MLLHVLGVPACGSKLLMIQRYHFREAWINIRFPFLNFAESINVAGFLLAKNLRYAQSAYG